MILESAAGLVGRPPACCRLQMFLASLWCSSVIMVILGIRPCEGARWLSSPESWRHHGVEVVHLWSLSVETGLGVRAANCCLLQRVLEFLAFLWYISGLRGQCLNGTWCSSMPLLEGDTGDLNLSLEVFLDKRVQLFLTDREGTGFIL